MQFYPFSSGINEPSHSRHSWVKPKSNETHEVHPYTTESHVTQSSYPQ